MGYVYGRTDSYAIGLWLLSITAALTLVLTLTLVRRTARAHAVPKENAAPATPEPE
jgi:NNP family nitrate/nitrite transporter-like MFS transporter